MLPDDEPNDHVYRARPVFRVLAFVVFLAALSGALIAFFSGEGALYWIHALLAALAFGFVAFTGRFRPL
jgi:hypothetical protein